MRQPLKIILAVVLAAGIVIAIAIAIGSDDEPQSGGSRGSDQPKTSAKGDPKPTSARGQMVNCMERAGFEVTHEDQDAATATKYTVQGDDAGSEKAEVVIHSNRDDAQRSSIKAAGEGINAVAFGRAEFIPREATNSEAGVLANCVAEGYVH